MSEHGKMDVNKEQDLNTEHDLNIEDEPSAAAHQDATVSDNEDESDDLIDFPPPPLTLNRHDTSPRHMTATNIKELWDHIKNRKKGAA